MPVRVGTKDQRQIVFRTSDWKPMKTPLKQAEFAVATDLYFVDVSKS